MSDTYCCYPVERANSSAKSATYKSNSGTATDRTSRSTPIEITMAGSAPAISRSRSRSWCRPRARRQTGPGIALAGPVRARTGRSPRRQSEVPAGWGGNAPRHHRRSLSWERCGTFAEALVDKPDHDQRIVDDHPSLSPRKPNNDAPSDGDFQPVVAKLDPDQGVRSHGRHGERIGVSGSKGLNCFKFIREYGQNIWFSFDSGRF